MFGFSKRSQADKAIEILPDAIAMTANKWLYFSNTLVFKTDIRLAQQITIFSVPFFESLRSTFPVLKRSPDSLLLLIVALGVEQSATHSKDEIERELEIKLPK